MVEQNSLKQILANLTIEEWIDLKATTLYQRLQRQLHLNGRLNVALGLLTVWLGMSAPNQTIYTQTQTVVGIITIVVSLIAWMRTSLTGLRLFVGLFILVGAWNLFLGFRDNFAGLGLWAAFFGLIQLSWSLRFQREYQRYKSQNIEIEPKSSALFKQIHSTLRNNTFVDDPNYIELQVYNRLWNGFLVDDKAVLSYKKSPYVIVANQSDFFLYQQIKIREKAQAFGDIGIQLEPKLFAARRIKPQFFERYLSWKGNVPLTEEMTNKLKRMLQLQKTRPLQAALIFVGIAIFALWFISTLR
jgi:hypothetical protein